MRPRAVARLIKAHRQTEGEGFPIRRPFPSGAASEIDPFLMLDEVGPINWPPGKALGAPDHPHRGFETISYVLSGEKLHEDSTGKRQVIGPGDVQWMTAGAGIVHSELPNPPFKARGGRAHSFQIWVNLPAREKFAEPGYQYLAANDIPRAHRDGVAVAVIAGEALGVSARIGTKTPVWLQDWRVAPGAAAATRLPSDFNAAAYVFEGAVSFGGEETSVEDGYLAVLGPGDTLDVSGGETGGRFLLLAGKPLDETIARYGPFVMNTRDELMAAFTDFQSGRMGAITRR